MSFSNPSESRAAIQGQTEAMRRAIDEELVENVLRVDVNAWAEALAKQYAIRVPVLHRERMRMNPPEQIRIPGEAGRSAAAAVPRPAAFGTTAANAARSGHELQEWMGHADYRTTRRYLHYRPRGDEAARLGAAFAAASPTSSAQGEFATPTNHP